MTTPGTGLEEFCRKYCSERLNLTSGAAEQLAVAVRTFGQWLQHEPLLTDLTKPAIIAWMKALSLTRAPSTVNSKRQALLALWRAAADEGLLGPPPRIAKLVCPVSQPVAWRLEDVGRLLRACDDLPGDWQGLPVSLVWKILLLVIWDTGSRIGSVLGARLADVDFSRGLWYVPARNLKGRRRDRLFALHPSTVSLIQESTRWPRDRLFPWPYTRRRLFVVFGKLLERAGLPNDRDHKFHCLRRTVASLAAQQRGIGWAAAAIGHSEKVCREHYISPAIYQPPSLVEALPRPTF